MDKKKYLKKWEKSDVMIQNSRKNKFDCIKEMMLEGMTYTDIGKVFGVSEQYISFYYKDYYKKNYGN